MDLMNHICKISCKKDGEWLALFINCSVGSRGNRKRARFVHLVRPVILNRRMQLFKLPPPPPPPHFFPFSKGRNYELSLHFFAMNGMESKPRIKKMAIIITEKGSIFVIQAGTRVRKVDHRMPSRKNIHYGFSAAAVVDRPFHNCSVKKKFDPSKYFFRY